MATATEVVIRRARLEDLPHIHNLIRESFLAMLDYLSRDMEQEIVRWAEQVIAGDLSPSSFGATYLSSTPGSSAFWVAELPGIGVCGCVGLKRIPGHRDDAELVRMSVSSTVRSGGVGTKLVRALEAFCVEQRVLRVVLTTANPAAGRFYLTRCGFSEATSFKFTHPTGGEMSGLIAVKYLAERLVRTVAIVGGTHGNERLGVELVEQWTRNPAVVARSTLRVLTWVGNPAAVAANTRFVGTDLNRLFEVDPIGESSAVQLEPEASRAAEIRALVAEHQVDFIIDMHSSNADVGLVAMIPAGESDVIATRVAAGLAAAEAAAGRPPLRITWTDAPKRRNWSVDAAAPSGLSFEVGPLPHGTLSSGLLEATRRLVLGTLDAIESRNAALLAAASGGGAPVIDDRIVPLSVAPSLIHMPCPRPMIEVFVRVASVPYPKPPAVTTTASQDAVECGGGISPISPLDRFLVHPSLEGPNWRPISAGDPAFISASGSGEIHPFVIPTPSGSEGGGQSGATEPLFTMFVNEAAYQASGTAFAVYKKTTKVLL